MDREVLLNSLLFVDGQEHRLTPRCYEILFERRPELRSMFGADLRPQEAMLRQALLAVLDHLDDAEWLRDTLGDLGRKHTTYGVTSEMYGWVTGALITAMAELGGERWTTELTVQWTDALTAVSTLMQASAREPAV